MSEQASKEGERQGESPRWGLSDPAQTWIQRDAHLTQSRRGKGTVLTGQGGSFPSPQGGERTYRLPTDSSLDSER